MSEYTLPEDAIIARQAVLDLLAAAGEHQKFRAILYGFNDSDFANAIVAAFKRGCDCKLILDHTQSTGKPEIATLHGMLINGFPPENIRIGTSDVSRQIVHDKIAMLWTDDPMPGKQYKDWHDALAEGYPVGVEGSFNWTGTALKEMNTMTFIPGQLWVATMAKIFDNAWLWISQMEPQYQLSGTTG